jgi:phage shock protein A
MRWLVDLFKEIPLSVVLREQLRAARDEAARLDRTLAACEAERVSLAKQLYAARAEIERLRGGARPARAKGDYGPLERY